MNICIFARVTIYHGIGGMETHTLLFSESLARKGHTVVIITTDNGKKVQIETRNGVIIYYIQGVTFKRYSLNWWMKSRNVFLQLNERYKFDAIFSESSAGFSYILYKLRKKVVIPFIHITHGTTLDEFRSVFKQRLSWKNILMMAYDLFNHFTISAICLQYSDIVIAVSKELQTTILKETCLIDKKRVIYLPNGVDKTKFFPSQRSNEINPFTLLCVGRISEQKGFQLVISALPRVRNTFKDTRLIIVGSGDYLPVLKKQASNLGLSDAVIFAGSVPEEKLNLYYNRADVFIVPSLRIEGLPYTILEAMACQLSIIASNSGGIPTAIRNNENGFLIPLNNLKVLQQKILYLLENRSRAEYLAKNAHQDFLKYFDNDVITEKFLSLLHLLKLPKKNSKKSREKES